MKLLLAFVVLTLASISTPCFGQSDDYDPVEYLRKGDRVILSDGGGGYSMSVLPPGVDERSSRGGNPVLTVLKITPKLVMLRYESKNFKSTRYVARSAIVSVSRPDEELEDTAEAEADAK